MAPASSPAPKLAVDLITLYDTSFWGVDDFNAFYDNSILPPEKFWDRALDTVADTEVQGIEVTFGPGHWRNALSRYGSAEHFADEVRDRGLRVCSGFYTGLVLDGDWRPAERRAAILEEVRDYADFLRRTGGDIMVAGLPMRRSWDDPEPQYVDLAYAQGLADVLNRMGRECLQQGVRLAIHPETHAVLWHRRDIDLFMLLTDPTFVSLCPDTAHITLGGTNPCDVVRDHAGRIVLTHWKDALGEVDKLQRIDAGVFKSHHSHFAPVGAGEVDWPQWVRTLREIGYDGWCILELDAAADPRAAIVQARDFVRTSLRPHFN